MIDRNLDDGVAVHLDQRREEAVHAVKAMYFSQALPRKAFRPQPVSFTFSPVAQLRMKLAHFEMIRFEKDPCDRDANRWHSRVDRSG